MCLDVLFLNKKGLKEYGEKPCRAGEAMQNKVYGKGSLITEWAQVKTGREAYQNDK